MHLNILWKVEKMKSKLLSLNIILIVVNLVVTVQLLIFPTIEYASYAEYVLIASYVGIFSMGLSETFQRKVADKVTNYSKKDILIMFLGLSTINIITFTLLFKILSLELTYLIIIVTYNNYYLSKNLLSLTNRFNEVKVLEIIERFCFLIVIIVFNNINLIIVIDVILKILFTFICFGRTISLVNGDELKYQKQDFINGMLMMLGNWLLIVALNMDKEVMLTVGKAEFGIYSVALSLFMVLNSLILPLRIYYFSKVEHDPTEILNKVAISLVMLAFVAIEICLNFNFFPEKVAILLIFKDLLFLLPLYIQVNINLINQMQLKKTSNFAIINVIIITLAYSMLPLITESINGIIFFKFIILFMLYCGYMYSLKRKGIMKMLILTLILWLLRISLIMSLILIVIYFVGSHKYELIKST